MRTSCTGMDSKARVAIRLTVHDLDIVSNLKGYTVAVIVPCHAVLDRGVPRLVKVNGTASTPVDIAVFVLVAINDQIFERYILCLDSAKNGKAVPYTGTESFDTVVAKCHRTDTQGVPVDRHNRGDADVPTAV